MKTQALNDWQRQLVEDNMLLVPFVLHKYFDIDKKDFEDYMSVGYIGLCKAASSFDPDAGSFGAYACKGIRNIVINEIRKGWTKGRGEGIKPVSLNTVISESDDESELIEFIEDKSENVERQVLDQITYDYISKLVPTTKRLYVDTMDIRKLTKELKCTRQGVYAKVHRECRKAKKILELEEGVR